jgi:hypothetical protein
MVDYKLVPAPVPARRGGGRPAIYVQMLSDFAALKESSVRIDYERKPDTIYNGLAAALRKNPSIKGVSVTRRGDGVYLVHKK